MSASTEQRLPALVIASLGVVFGDIGTSPLYAFKEAIAAHGAGGIPPADSLFAVLSMMFWAVTIIVSLKYVIVMLRFDYRGEGGALALLSIALARARSKPRLIGFISALGILAASLFYGDAIITPAISVLSAVEGIALAAPATERLIVPIALLILVSLFLIQRRGTAKIGALFGPVMILWFLVLAALGVRSIVETPQILGAVNPVHAIGFAIDQPGLTLILLGAVFLTLTGAEVMYADLGHFGPRPIRISWFALVFPCLMLNYFGQGALVLRDPEAVRNPFYLLAPEPLLIPLIVLATCATVIASQATISGAFSVTQQASRLNYLPRLKVRYTSETSRGQIYIPVVNWMLLVAVVLLVLGFRSSSQLAAAYGIAVSGDLLIGTALLSITVLLRRQASTAAWLFPAFLVFGALEVVFFISNASKVAEGGWFPLAVATVMFAVLSTWRRGTEIVRSRKDASPRSRGDAFALDLSGIQRVPGTAVFFSSGRSGHPTSFLHNLRHNRVAHEQVIFLTVDFVDVPRVPDHDRLEIERGGNGIVRIVASFGFREEPNIALVLSLARRRGVSMDANDTSYFTSKPVIVSTSRRGVFGWRRSLFGWMLQNSSSTASYFALPPNRVVELGTQVAI
jgi:KUP system potassium uptake protein